mmetsp:Transcript_3875/g.521  ORF Transcript_3875/g.521 Transcript_3875/m.521 type:complete len:104 (+) Transcript_3875:603-914(+)
MKWFREGRPENVYIESDLPYRALAGLCSYLEFLMIADKLTSSGTFEEYNPHSIYSNTMVLNSKTLQRLEILEAKTLNGWEYKGSLLHFINKTKSRFGSRMIKR